MMEKKWRKVIHPEILVYPDGTKNMGKGAKGPGLKPIGTPANTPDNPAATPGTSGNPGTSGIKQNHTY